MLDHTDLRPIKPHWREKDRQRQTLRQRNTDRDRDKERETETDTERERPSRTSVVQAVAQVKTQIGLKIKVESVQIFACAVFV